MTDNSEAAERLPALRLLTITNLDKRIEMAKPYVPYDGPVVTRAEARAAGLTHFFSSIPCKHGHLSQRFVMGRQCLTCQRAVNKDRQERGYFRRWTQKNPEKTALYRKTYDEKHPGAIDASITKYRNANRNLLRARDRERYAEDPEFYSEKNAAYRRANPEIFAAHARNRRALKKQSEGSHTKNEILALFKRQKGKCANCRTSIRNGYHADHILPLTLGGANWISNIQLLCIPCNLRKNALHPIEFAQREGRLL